MRENMNGMTSRGMNYWESARRPRPAPDLRDEQPAAGGRREDRQVDHVVRHQRRRRPARRARRPRPGDASATSSRARPGEVFENLIIARQRDGRRLHVAAGDIRAYDVLTGKLVWTFHTVPRPGEFGYDTWPKDAWKYIGGANNWGEMTVDTRRGIAYIPTRLAHLRLLRRRPHRQQPVRDVDRRARRAHRQAPVALPVRCTTTSGTSTPAPRRN